MKTLAHKQESRLIVYDADTIQHPGPFLFSPEYWSEQDAVKGQASGRGSVLLLDTEFGPAVLRQYLRGGWAAKVSSDRYIFSGFDQSRPIAEFGVLERLSAEGLPVPQPLAAMCSREGAFYRAWLLMRRIPDVAPLADLIQSRHEDPALWYETGACIRRFHDKGLNHADLNARNILVSDTNEIHLIDFDRAKLGKKDTRAFRANLRRLHRSLQKVWPKAGRGQIESCWRKLLEGYDRRGVAT